MSSIWVDLLGSEVRFYDAGGVRTRCIEAGEGEAVIYMHGIGGHAEAFARNVVPLSDRFRSISVDYLGFGLTDKPAAAPTHVDYATHLVDLLDALGVERAHLVGESLGGWVAMWTALLHPDRVGKIISVCGARLEVDTDEESARHAKDGFAELQRRSQEFVKNPTRENVRHRLDWLFHNPARDVTDELVDLRWAIYQRAQAEARMATVGHGVTQQRPADVDDGLTPERLGQIKSPTLMLWTSHNPTTTAATAQRATAYLPNGSFTLMEECAHWPQWEDAERFNEIAREFLSGD